MDHPLPNSVRRVRSLRYDDPLALPGFDGTTQPYSRCRSSCSTPVGKFEIAFGKANGALALGMGSRGLMARAEQQPYFIGAVAAAIGGALVPVPGGVLVQSADGEVIGAVGVTGDTSDNDEAAAVDAIEAAGLRAVTE